jgi:hypothetical protein
MEDRGVVLAEEAVKRLNHRIAWLGAIRNMVTIALPAILAGSLWIFRPEVVRLSTVFHITIIITLAAILVVLLELEIQMFKAELRELIRDLERSFWFA